MERIDANYRDPTASISKFIDGNQSQTDFTAFQITNFGGLEPLRSEDAPPFMFYVLDYATFFFLRGAVLFVTMTL